MSGSVFPRRRHSSNRRRFRWLLRSVSAVSAVVLLLFAFISLLAPSPSRSNGHRLSLLSHKLPNDVDNDGAVVFRVPANGGKLDHDIWKSRLSKYYYGCSNASKKFADSAVVTKSNRYLLIVTSGGLNQQRTGIIDAVVAARILNATLVVPKLDQKSFWKDTSNFADIFDVDSFISHLSKDVKIIKELPRRSGKVWNPYTMRVPRKCNAMCYQSRVLPNLLKKRAVQLTKFDYRLSNKLDMDFQKLRCRVNYHALNFIDPIIRMGQKLVHQMRVRSKHFIALHLRFEPDMLAFSGCYYGGGDKERAELGAIRKRWKTLHISSPDKVRRQGRCPLTPEEVGLMLRALGYGKDIHVYVASGNIYGGENTLAPLKALFPNFHSKESLASKKELDKFSAFSSRMAALDFIVCDESDVFVTNNNGNMAKILAGRRRYLGHKPTIRPNAKKLYRLFLNRNNMTWDVFVSSVRSYQRGFMGDPKEVRPGRGQFHENPAACICEDSEALKNVDLNKKPGNKGNTLVEKEIEEVFDVENDDDDPEWSDEQDDEDEQNGHIGKEMFNRIGSDYDNSTFEEPELEELLSD